MTTKTAGKTPSDRPVAELSPEALQVAYQVHTLSQLMYRELVAGGSVPVDPRSTGWTRQAVPQTPWTVEQPVGWVPTTPWVW